MTSRVSRSEDYNVQLILRARKRFESKGLKYKEYCNLYTDLSISLSTAGHVLENSIRVTMEEGRSKWKDFEHKRKLGQRK